MVRPDSDRPDRQTISRLDIGTLIRDAREIAGLTQTQLAQQLGTKQPVISRWERNLDSPRIDTLGRILQACGFEADLVFRRRDDVDRAEIRRLMDLTPEERIADLARRTRMFADELARWEAEGFQ